MRYNAVALFIDAFPLQNPDAPVAETEEALQKQFDQLQALLIEPEVSVRTLGVTGMCARFGLFELFSFVFRFGFGDEWYSN